ncbi:Mannosyl phosphorylinositol ceramide synthase CSH1 [Fulvia fulva]|uniref:Mannosyl phosphorylinositol ceramide synthase CSH1 n=1 Tax=Passalora fulva TaxID=5499 RepID=A0A9Q8UQU5_PASFU|nr:Mannosyl phosphorylinositol ceramide synthase CSH1 [Fulvia fulva]KAK4622204.1 Mannosyl phosphorylinositol ceramide synthase CSH1 [Fulvia fulva]KAK4623321.1 Mannosyl phosphorylinositol ceramide synthase CSH1 [Fulvia fulva]UJO19119.1 Mannosyl phosphorylinositol ceramide synthase CSH1 [Fulvia fulva]WPV15920.1 Mannosyl phosphorylinositol ceramide synthase CSH1 [Fulvia fulva]WPV31115.1 Mannosyl phosphorylinositol ceramide synthase CSH1 [Fulvia fulva]
MRRPLVIFLVIIFAVLLFLIHLVWTLLELLVITGIQDAITKEELPAIGAEDKITAKPLIPKIIHQTYINTSIPEVWQDAQASCKTLHQKSDGWEYKLWTDKMSVDFIEEEYPEFLETFKGYQYPIQRADAIRYFVLDHFGGIYIDLDDGCNRPLEPLLSYPAFVRKTVPTGVSNDAMGAVPGHPFFKRVIQELERYDRSWILPYITVMASTGPLFLSVIWRHYSDEGLNVGDGADGGRIRIIFPEEYNSHPWSFFTHHLGNSWHGYDVQLIFWMARNWVLLTFIGLVVGISAILLGWWSYHRYFLAPTDIPQWKKKSVRDRLAFWSNRHQSEYELVNRHEP